MRSHVYIYTCADKLAAPYESIQKHDLIVVAAIEGLVREEQFLHGPCILGAATAEITQILTRANYSLSHKNI